MEGATLPCFECLERVVRSDLSADLVFRYGVSDSALPIGSTAVVQVSVSSFLFQNFASLSSTSSRD